MSSGGRAATGGRFTAETQRRRGGRTGGGRRACRRYPGVAVAVIRQIRWKEPMPSGGSCRGGPVWPPGARPQRATTWGRPYGVVAQILRKHPMPSGAAHLQRREERVHAAAVGSAGAAQGDHLGRVEAVGAAGGGAAGAPLGRARAGAEPAMHPAAPVLHGWLAAAGARAGVRAAARGGEEVAGRGAVPEPPATVAWQAGGGGAGVSGHGNLLGFFHGE
jgi:hypothetical protein